MKFLSFITPGLLAISLAAAHARAQIHPDLDRPFDLDSPREVAIAELRRHLKVLLNEPERSQIAVLRAIADLGPEETWAAGDVRPLLDAPSADVSRAAADALAAMGPAACPQWLDALKSPDGFTRLLALYAVTNQNLKLQNIKLNELYAALEYNLKDASPQIQLAAAQALLRFWPASAPVLVDAMKHGNHDVQGLMFGCLWYEHTAYLGETPIEEINSGRRLVKGKPDEQTLIELGRQFSPELLERLASKIDGTRKWTLGVLSELPPDAIGNSLAEMLVRQMKLRDESIAEDAAQTLTHLGDNALPGLIEGASSSDDTIKWICLDTLAKRTTAKSSAAAVAVLRNAITGPSWSIRKIALRWVDTLEAPPEGMVEILAGGLTPNQPAYFDDVLARDIAVRALGRFATKPKISVPAIMAALDPDNPIQMIDAIRALRGFGPDASIAVSKLVMLLWKDADTSTDVATTLAALGPGGRKAAAAYYVDRVANAGTAGDRLEAVRALAPLAGEAGDAIPLLGKLLASDDNMLRIEVARTLSQIGPKAAGTKPALIRMMDNCDPEIRAAAADALVKIAPDGAGLSPALMAAVYNGDRAAANRLAATLQRAGDTEALIRKLNDLASDDLEPAVRAAAKHAVECLMLDAGPASTTQPGK